MEKDTELSDLSEKSYKKRRQIYNRTSKYFKLYQQKAEKIQQPVKTEIETNGCFLIQNLPKNFRHFI